MKQSILKIAFVPALASIMFASSMAFADTSTANFSQGDNVIVAVTVNVRSAPSGALVGKQVVGATGTLVGGPVQMGGYTWWQIDYTTGADGWSAEDFLQNAKVSSTVIPQNANVAAVASVGTMTVDQKIAALKAQLQALLAVINTMTQTAAAAGSQH